MQNFEKKKYIESKLNNHTNVGKSICKYLTSSWFPKEEARTQCGVSIHSCLFPNSISFTLALHPQTHSGVSQMTGSYIC